MSAAGGHRHVVIALAFNGAGERSADNAIGWDLTGLASGLGSLGAALIGAAGVLAIRMWALAGRGDSEPTPRPGRQLGKVRPCRMALSRSRARCPAGALGRLAGSAAALAAPRRCAARAAGLLRNAGGTASVPGLPAARCMWSFAATPPFELFTARLRVRPRRRHRGNAYDLR